MNERILLKRLPHSMRWPLLFLSVACVLMVAAFVSNWWEKKAPPLRIGINAWPGYELLYLAQEKGYFRESGTEIRLVEFGSLADARRAYEMEKLDGLATTIVEVVMARDAAPRDLRVVRLFDFSSGADVIIASRDIQSIKDLRGKRIGVELASLGIYVLTRALELNGLTLDDVIPVSKDQHAMVQDIENGMLDAVVTYPPQATKLLDDARFHAVFTTSQIPGEVVDVLAIDGDVARKRPQQIEALFYGLERAYEFLQREPEEACRIMGEREGFSGPEFRQLLVDGITLVAPAEQVDYFGSTSRLQGVVDEVVSSLRRVELVSHRTGVEDCLLRNGKR